MKPEKFPIDVLRSAIKEDEQSQSSYVRFKALQKQRSRKVAVVLAINAVITILILTYALYAKKESIERVDALEQRVKECEGTI